MENREKWPFSGSPFEFFALLPWPVSVNRLYRRKAGGGIYKTAPGHWWQSTAAFTIRDASGFREMGPDCRLEVAYLLSPPTRRSFDVDNFEKAILDAVQASHLVDNDSQVYMVTKRKVDKSQPPWYDPGVYFWARKMTAGER